MAETSTIIDIQIVTRYYYYYYRHYYCYTWPLEKSLGSLDHSSINIVVVGKRFTPVIGFFMERSTAVPPRGEAALLLGSLMIIF